MVTSTEPEWFLDAETAVHVNQLVAGIFPARGRVPAVLPGQEADTLNPNEPTNLTQRRGGAEKDGGRKTEDHQIE